MHFLIHNKQAKIAHGKFVNLSKEGGVVTVVVESLRLFRKDYLKKK